MNLKTEFKNYLIILFCLVLSSSTLATALLVPKSPQKGDYQCYAGNLSNPEVKDITQVRIALQKDKKYASFIIFYKHKSKYSSDIFCKNYLGRCAIENDRGFFEILSLTKQSITIQFDGKPGIASINGSETSPEVGTEVFPFVDAHNKLKSPIRMELKIQPKSSCSY